MKEALEKRAAEAREHVGPLVETAKSALRQALDVPSREELVELTQRLERAVAALERAQAQKPEGDRKP